MHGGKGIKMIRKKINLSASPRNKILEKHLTPIYNSEICKKEIIIIFGIASILFLIGFSIGKININRREFLN
jgi:hypothetical protein